MAEPDGIVAIVTALPEELAPLLARLRGRTAERSDDRRLWRGSLGSTPVLLACAGDGNESSLRGVRALLAGKRPRALLGAGVAGALTEDLAPGRVVFGERIFDSSGESAAADPEWLGRARALSGAAGAAFFTSDRVACSPEERSALAARLPPGPAAVDLESASWARAAAEKGIPFLALRAISDGAGERLPGILSECQAPGGPVRRACVARRAILRPAALKSLLELRRRVRDASEALAGFVETLLQYDGGR